MQRLCIRSSRMGARWHFPQAHHVANTLLACTILGSTGSVAWHGTTLASWNRKWSVFILQKEKNSYMQSGKRELQHNVCPSHISKTFIKDVIPYICIYKILTLLLKFSTFPQSTTVSLILWCVIMLVQCKLFLQYIFYSTWQLIFTVQLLFYGKINYRGW